MIIRFRKILTPPRFLVAANLVCAALALVQGLVVARMLGAAGYGVMAIFVTLGGVAANFWDFRLIDLAIKIHYSLAHKEENPAPLQTANMQLALLLNLLFAFLMFASTAGLGLLCWSWFTEQRPATWWLIAQGIGIGGSFFIGTIQSMQRLTEDYYLFGIVRIITQFIALPLTLLFLFLHPNLDGYYDSLTATILLNLVLSIGLLSRLWSQRYGVSLWQRGMSKAWSLYHGQRRFIFSANILSYSKMLTRSGDVLVFGYFAGDAATGVYRLARTLADSLGILTTAFSQYYYPNIIKQLHANDHAAVLASAKKFILLCGLATLALMPLSWIGLSLVNVYFLKESYIGLPLATMLIVSTFVWTAGVHTWLWPILVERNQTHRLALTSSLGGLVQLSLTAILCVLFQPNPAFAALASIASYCVCYPPLLWWWHHHWRKVHA